MLITIWFIPFFLNPSLLTQKDNDLGRTYIPLFNFFRKSIYQNHQVPLWRPDQFMGETFIGNPLSSLFYPANIIFIIFEVETGSIIYLYIHILIAAISTFYLAKSFSLSNNGALTAALFYSLSTKILVHIEAGHITMIAAFSLFPLVFLSIRKLSVRYESKWLSLASVTLALTYFAYPTIFYYVFIFISIYWFYRLIPNFKINRKKILKPLLIYVSLTILAIFIMAIELLPHLEFAPLSTRSQLSLEDVALPLWNLKRFTASLLFPYLEKTLGHEAFLYLGLVPITLSVIGFFTLSKIRKTIFFCGSGFMLLYVSGLSTPVFPALYQYLPLLNYSRITTRPWFVMALLIALLSALAIDKIKNKKVIYLVVSLFLVENLLLFNFRLSKIPKLSFSNEALYQFFQNDKDIYRVYCTTYCFNPQLLSKYNVQILNGESPIQQKSTVDYLENAGNYVWQKFAVIFPPYQVWQTDNPPVPNASKLGMANVKYVASTYPINEGNYIFLEKFENIYLYKNSQFSPRFYFENSQEPVYLASYSSNEVNIKFERQKTAKTITISESYYPGWVASIVNQKFKVELKDQVFKEVIVPSDTEDVWLKFQPKSYIMGKTITLGTLTFLLLYLIKKRKNK